MSLLKADFDEVLARIRQGRELSTTGFEPVYYLIFPPAQLLEVKRTLPAWLARLRNEGWNPQCFSMAEQVTSILQQAPQRRFWLAGDAKAPLNWERTNQALVNALAQGRLKDRLAAFLAECKTQPNAIALITDLEALHPYLRIGTLEGQLYGQFQVPTIILYPGACTGKTRLSFLGFYAEDGNYRSVHVGC